MVTLMPGARPIGAVNATKQSVGQMSFSGRAGQEPQHRRRRRRQPGREVGGVVQNYTVEGIEELRSRQAAFRRERASGGRAA